VRSAGGVCEGHVCCVLVAVDCTDRDVTRKIVGDRHHVSGDVI
jgi:hypothetical protein